MIKKWNVYKSDREKIKQLAHEGGMSELSAEILSAAGYDDFESASEFFGDGTLSDPFSIIDMQAAVDAIEDMVFENGDRVCIYGDYDCDGVTATTLLYTYFLSNAADVTYHINSREQGFGLNEDIIRELHEDGVRLIITVDNGISAVKEAELIKKLGMSLIITDHHEPGEKIPDAIAVVDPHRDDNESAFTDYCGCGVALMLAAALMNDTDAALEQFSDLAALATVADMVPLVGENRTIVIKGLRYLERSENIGIRELIGVSGKIPPFVADDIGFGFGPRINAANRVEHAKTAFELLTCEDSEKAREIAAHINNLNNERKTLTYDITNIIRNKLRDEPNLLCERVICIYIPNAHHGVIGLSAGDIQRLTGKPCYLCTDDKDGLLKGSARSVDGFSIKDAFRKTGHLLTKFGGHELAGGFSLKSENFGKFSGALQMYAKEYSTAPGVPVLDVIELPSADCLWLEKVKEIETLAPFGQKFERPMFLLRNSLITGIYPTKTGDYVSMKFEYKGYTLRTTLFDYSIRNFIFDVGQTVDIVVVFKIDTYTGSETVGFDVKDIRLSSFDEEKFLQTHEIYERFRRGVEFDTAVKSRVYPTREERLAICQRIENSDKEITIDGLLQNVENINAFKILVILDSFAEAGILKPDKLQDKLEYIKPLKRIDLENTPTIKRLK
jgi:single-stranded-DNA-specific exonuclease